MTIVCSCGKRLKAAGAVPGRLGRCPKCRTEFRVPERSPIDESASAATARSPRAARSPGTSSEVDDEVAETGHQVMREHGRTGSSYVASRHGGVKATVASGPVERCGLLKMPSAPELSLGQSFLFPFWDMAGIGWIVSMSIALTPFSLAVAALANVVSIGGIFAARA